MRGHQWAGWGRELVGFRNEQRLIDRSQGKPTLDALARVYGMARQIRDWYACLALARVAPRR